MIRCIALACIALCAIPAFAASPRKVFTVADFGALPGTAADSGPGIRKAIAAAIACGEPADVVFDSGNYRIASLPTWAWWSKAHLFVRDAKDLVLRGTGKTVLTMTDPGAAGVVLYNCDKIVAQDLTIDYDPVPQILCRIVSIDPNHDFIEVVPEPGHPGHVTLDDPMVSVPNSHIMGTTYQLNDDGSVKCWGECPVGLALDGKTGENRYKLVVPVHPGYTRRDAIGVAGLRVGDLFVSNAGGQVGAAFSMIANKSAEARGITLWASPGLAFFPHANDSVTLSGCTVQIKPGSHRPLSTDADGIHSRGNRHTVIENCVFEGTGDDAINLHASAAVPLSRISSTTIVFKRHTYTVRAGDTMEQIRPETGLVLGKYLVKSVEAGKDGVHVEFDRPVADVTFGTDVNSGDQFFNLDEANDNFEIRGNTFGKHRGRDLLLSAYRGVVENNRFQNLRPIPRPRVVSTDEPFMSAMRWLTGTSIQICYDPGWGEGPITEGVVIRGNTFTGYDMRSPAIWISDHVRSSGGYAAGGSHKDIAIENNVFENRNASVVVARYVTGLIIKGNKVEGRGLSVPAGPPTEPAFDLTRCPDAVVDDNKVEDNLYAKVVENKL